MSSQISPWPIQTPPPTPPKRRRHRDVDTRLSPRQVIADAAEIERAQDRCRWAGNDVTSCFPTSNSTIPQHQWATFVWNSQLPTFVQTNLVNIYLYRGDSLTQIKSWTNYPNPYPNAGVVRSQVDDSWWGDDGEAWDGANITYPFYWVITRADEELDGSETTQPIFQAVQTTYADSVISSMASTASSASEAAASLSSLSAAGSSLTALPPGASGTPTNGGTGNVQSGSGGSGFPEWAIAVIVLLGFFALAASCILAFFIVRRVRRQNEIDSNRNSMGSSSPMMANVGNSPGSPLLAQGVVGAGTIDRHSSVGHGGTADNAVSPDGASIISRAGSAGDTGPFSGADAAIMADAFRKALRKPDFAGRPVEEGESPDNPETEGGLLNRELAEEGRDIRSVSSSRGVRVETLSDSGDTIHDHR